ncbi:MAG: 2'-5' RNA ligase family protein [Caldilineaceae bacterium]
MSSDHAPFILTLKLDDESFRYFTALRDEHFPTERNYLSAHITLFHKLPGDEGAHICEVLADISAEQPPLSLHFPGVQSLGGGVAIQVESRALLRVRQRLATAFADWLSPQDQQRFRPHITVQNKVRKETAAALHTQLSTMWQPFDGVGEGLILWRYRGGPWERIDEFLFLSIV